MARTKHVQIIYEDNHLIAVNKPAGVSVHSDESGDETLVDVVKAYIKKEYNKPGDVFLGVIHRIDRPVSGVVIFARTSKALTRMNDLLKKREIKKVYLAIVRSIPENLEGSLEHYLYKDTKKNRARIHQSDKKGAKLSRLTYKYTSGMSGFHMLEVRPETGRSHQIRIQLASMGTPIVGDLKYGFSNPNQDKSICLHCKEMSFIHPVKKEPISIRARVPRFQIWDLFNTK